ncbi:unnamed protein product [Moneuplotes crassus]|uniref:CCT domain-containing protein n=1 Tax=Euplotes crassus TaxID=5936 RepID=A0AAD1UML6_EUPCR|nr:unnamed protein product [Moneuplotes crassus]
MNQFNDFSIQDEYLEDQYEKDEIVRPVLTDTHEDTPINFSEEYEEERVHPSLYTSSSDIELSDSFRAIQSIGSHLFSNITHKSHKMFWERTKLSQKFANDMNSSLTKGSSINPTGNERTVLGFNALAKSFNFEYRHLDSLRSCQSDNGESCESSIERSDANEKICNLSSSELPGESLENAFTTNIISQLDSQSSISKQSGSGLKGCSKLQMPKPCWNFGMLNQASLKPFFIDIKTDNQEKSTNFENGQNCVNARDLLKKSEEIAAQVGVQKDISLDKDITQITAPISLKNKNSAKESMIGKFTKSERALKVKRYLEKKRRRRWSTNVNYQSRKRVADNRPRLKGRFLSTEQALCFAKELEIEQKKRLEKAKIFMIEVFDRKTRQLRKRIYPNKKALEKYTTQNLV